MRNCASGAPSRNNTYVDYSSSVRSSRFPGGGPRFNARRRIYSPARAFAVGCAIVIVGCTSGESNDESADVAISAVSETTTSEKLVEKGAVSGSEGTTTQGIDELGLPLRMNERGDLPVGETRTRRVSAHCGMDVLFWEIDGSQWWAVNPTVAISSHDLPDGWTSDEDELIDLAFERVSEHSIIARPVGTDLAVEYRRADDQDENFMCM